MLKNKNFEQNEKKVDIDNSRTECGKKMSKYIFIGLKKRLVWVI